MNDKPKPGFEDDDKLPELAKPSRGGFVLLFALIIVAIVYVIPYVYTANAVACASCHRMKPYYDSWLASGHRDVTPSCLDCHADQNVFSLFAYRLMFYRELVAEVTGADLKPLGTTKPGEGSCHRSGCHSLNRLTSTSGELKINHRRHVVGERLSCAACHAGIVHEGVRGRSVLPPRRLCRRCHERQMGDCRYCHARETGDNPPDEAH